VELYNAPNTLYDLWKEYTHGLNGNKPARDFTPKERGANKSLYCRRKVFWDSVNKQCNTGVSHRVAIGKIYAAYGIGLPVTKILLAMTKDKARGGHPNLR
jgi:hypothetical protein